MRSNILLYTLLLTLSLQAKDVINAGTLKVALASPVQVDKIPMGNYLGKYNYPLANRFTISAYVDGFVTEINAKPYATVKKGQKLFAIKSPKLLDLQSDYISTLLEFEFYQKEVKRLKPLSEKGVVASKRYIEAKNRYEKFKAAITFKENLLLAYGLSKKALKKVKVEHKAYPKLVITSPVNATISMLKLQVGSFVREGETLAKLIDTTECHFEIDIPWQVSQSVTAGDKLYSQYDNFTVFAISPDIDPISQTRGVDLHGKRECKALGGASINVTLYQKLKGWKVPASAVVGIDGKHAIFVAAKGGYHLVSVIILAQLEGAYFINAPLQASDKVAISSVLALKSASEGEEE